MSESLEQRVASKAVIEAEGGLLSVHPSEIDANRNWQWPGGIREPEEIEQSMLDVCVREVLEETAIDLEGVDHTLLRRYGEWYAVDKGEKVKILAIFFHFQLPARPSVTLSHEHDDSAWLDLSNHENYQANPEVHEVVQGLFNR